MQDKYRERYSQGQPYSALSSSRASSRPQIHNRLSRHVAPPADESRPTLSFVPSQDSLAVDPSTCFWFLLPPPTELQQRDFTIIGPRRQYGLGNFVFFQSMQPVLPSRRRPIMGTLSRACRRLLTIGYGGNGAVSRPAAAHKGDAFSQAFEREITDSHKEPRGIHDNEDTRSEEPAETIRPPVVADGGQGMTRADPQLDVRQADRVEELGLGRSFNSLRQHAVSGNRTTWMVRRIRRRSIATEWC